MNSADYKLLFLFGMLLLLLAGTASVGYSQVISGQISDESTGEKLFGAAILEKGTSNGVTTDFEGNFKLEVSTIPCTLVVSYIGYVNYEVAVSSSDEKIRVKLKSEDINLEDLTIVESRVTQKQQESPVTVESMDAMAVKETPAVNFYDGLGHLKGVDLTVASMGFKVVNTRGFNSTRPVRSLQIIDGVDNQAPGLNFSVGNFAGASELDIQRVELIVGANSGLYGPNAFNGVISMETKDPFLHQGLDVLGKVGERNLRETAVRLARAHRLFGSEKEVIGWKLNFSYMKAYDWVADNYNPVQGTNSPTTNPGGYDAVNRYGDEILIPGTNDFTDDFGQLQRPGLGKYYRTGYKESDLVDYNTENLKVSPSIYVKLPKDITAKMTFNYGTGTTVYQGDNRYSLKDLQMWQYIGEIGKKDKFFVRAFHTAEDAGRSYDAVFTAMLLQDAAKSNQDWSVDYEEYWFDNNIKKVRQLPNYPDPTNTAIPGMPQLWFGDTKEATQLWAQAVIMDNLDSLYRWHQGARNKADAGGPKTGTVARYEPGTARFDSAFSSITSRKTYLEGGSGFYDRSSLTNFQAQYTLDEKELGIKRFKWLLGGNYRVYNPRSEGTIFADTNGREITNSEFGFYTNLQQRIFADRIILSVTARADKNQNFDAVYSPAASVVYNLNEKQTFRASFSSAIRNPTLQDQFLYYNVGRAILIGNIDGYKDLVTVESFFDAYDGTTYDWRKLDTFDVDPVRPEKVRTVEFGYKGNLGNRVFIDLSYYYSWYTDFLGYVVGAQVSGDSTYGRIDQVYRVTANSETQVTTQGVSVGLNYYFKKYFTLTGNYSWNVLNKDSLDDPIIPAFNTPAHKFNLGISASGIKLKLGGRTIQGLGFNINYKWIQGFLFEGSPQFTGTIPTYDILDAQVSYLAKKINTTFKLGASNALNRLNFQTYGGPRIGRMAYFSILYELGRVR